MVRIVSMENCSNWPRIIRCNNTVKVRQGDGFVEKTCPATLEVSHPADMTLVKYDGTPPQYDAVVKCPLCDKEHHIDTDSLPAEIFEKIPLDPRSGIMSYHD